MQWVERNFEKGNEAEHGIADVLIFQRINVISP